MSELFTIVLDSRRIKRVYAQALIEHDSDPRAIKVVKENAMNVIGLEIAKKLFEYGRFDQMDSKYSTHYVVAFDIIVPPQTID